MLMISVSAGAKVEYHRQELSPPSKIHHRAAELKPLSPYSPQHIHYSQFAATMNRQPTIHLPRIIIGSQWLVS